MRSFSAQGVTCILPIIRWNGTIGALRDLDEKRGINLNSEPKTPLEKPTIKPFVHRSEKGSMSFKFRRNMYGVTKGKVIEIQADSAKEALRRLSRRTGYDEKYFVEVTE